MRIEIEIPKEFEEHFNQDKFKDSFKRIMTDIEHFRHSSKNGYWLCAGRYEYETIEMLQKAFENSKQVYPVEKVVEELKERKHEICLSDDDLEYYQNGIDDAIEIVKHGDVSGASEDICEWKFKNVCYTTSIKHYYSLPTSIVKTFNNCPYCGKKIKVVE